MAFLLDMWHKNKREVLGSGLPKILGRVLCSYLQALLGADYLSG
jgi:hypothetical protein